ncbi:hypothetical protein [Acetobacter persici]|uniref:hypothetical protein n=1 Tax=Acetobacter persici TaxID=1076596 RepID=UPI001F3D63DC|nr:hypothetical protein [Acetobacter persici]MCG0998193.1 hypothetical protein [Acetobacter persici]
MTDTQSGGNLVADGGLMPSYMTRAEGSEIRRQQQITNERLAIVEHEQQGQKTTLAEILAEVRKGQSVRAMFIAGGSGLGGGVAAGVAYFLHWITQ